jgi:metal-responsive CopG/Arc/MetJ family transcriptional regulator
MKTAISIPDELFKEVDNLTKRLGMSRSELYATAVSEYLRDHRNDAVTERLNEIYRKEPSAADVVLKTLQFASLEKEEW